jgi:hypothetical protein
MGNEMTGNLARLTIAMLASVAGPVMAQSTPVEPRHAIGADVTFSTDADSTEVFRAGTNLDWLYHSPDHYFGVRLERIAYRPSGQDPTVNERVYLRAADALGKWNYHATVGTDGHTVLGNASINDSSSFRKEFFVERDKVETPLGVAKPIFFTFVGATLDIPLARTTQLTLLGGAQEFTGRNVRTHVRANLIQVIKEDWGLSAQLRSRFSRNSVPQEFDYFSPRWYAEVLPVVQVRRFVGGWQYLGAAGWGAQRDSQSGWRQSRYLNLRLSSPASRRGWIVNADATYSNTPITRSDTYDYLRGTFSLTRAW